MRVRRPSGVSSGCTDRQLDTAPQSPQPSQTRGLMAIRLVGVATLPRLRPRRSSAAHGWWCTSTVTPSTAASSVCTSTISSRSRTATSRGRPVRS